MWPVVIHLELQKFISENESFHKIGFLLSFSIPRRLSFPVYMGVAAGPGFFVKPGKWRIQVDPGSQSLFGITIQWSPYSVFFTDRFEESSTNFHEGSIYRLVYCFGSGLQILKYHRHLIYILWSGFEGHLF